MPIDAARAVGARLPDIEHSWTGADIRLYHLAVGAGPADDPRYLLEDRLWVLPAYAALVSSLGVFEPPAVRMAGVDVPLSRVLHLGQEITLHAPLPPDGSVRVESVLSAVWDKGSAAVLVRDSVATGPSGPLWTSRSTMYARGEGGFGGERGPGGSEPAPTAAPDLVLDTPTLPQQALLYRLCGDGNPLHADPAAAAEAGLGAPILHGLCTFALVCKALLDRLGVEPTRVRTCGARFSGIVLPGEALRTAAVVDPAGGGLSATTSVPARGGATALSGLRMTWE